MHELRLVGVTDDGSRLILAGAEEEFVLPIDSALRSALRGDAGHRTGQGHSADHPMSPVEVQALIRSGADAQEAAERAGWSVDKVHRYEGPILAERQHVARLASSVRLRPRGPASGSPTLLSRVTRRLADRDVATDDLDWDSWRGDDGQWVVEVHFVENGHHRRASWGFTKSSMTVRGLDREAARLSDDDPDLLDPGPDYDRAGTVGEQPTLPTTTSPAPHRSPAEDSDLMATLRSTSRARSRRRGGSARRSHTPAATAPHEDGPTTAGSGMPDTAPVEDDLHPDPGLEGTEEHLTPDPGSPTEPAPADHEPGDGEPGDGETTRSETGDTLADSERTDTEPAAGEPADTEPVTAGTGTPVSSPERGVHADPGLDGTQGGVSPDPGAPDAANPHDGGDDGDEQETGASAGVGTDDPRSDAESAVPVTATTGDAPGQVDANADGHTDVSNAHADEPTTAGTGIPARVEDDLHPDPGLHGTNLGVAPDPGTPAASLSSAATHEEPPLPFDDDVAAAMSSASDTSTTATTSTSDASTAPQESTGATPETTAEQQPQQTPAPRAKRTRRRKTATARPVQATETSAPSMPINDVQSATPAAPAQNPTAQNPAAQNPGAAKPAQTSRPKPTPPRAAGATQSAAGDATAGGGRSSSRRKGRASVPAWDDIMFGAKGGEDSSDRDE